MDGTSIDKHGFVVQEEEEELMMDICHGNCFEVQHDDGIGGVHILTLEKIRQMIKKGLSTQLRSKVWTHLLNPDQTKSSNATFNYQEFVIKLNAMLPNEKLSELTSKIDAQLNSQSDPPQSNDFFCTIRQISVDIDRTFPNHQMFKPGSTNQYSLFRILAAYSEYNKTVGYCQGMAYIAAVMLMNIEDEETVFWCFVSLLESEDHFHSFYKKDLKKVRVLTEMLSLLIGNEYPELAKHFKELGVHPLTYSTQWFMTLFTCLNCWDTVLLIADLFILDGLHQLLNAGLAILKLCQPEVLAMSRLDEVLPFIQNIPSRLQEVKSLIMSHPAISKKEELEEYWSMAETKINEEETSLERLKENYRQKNSRKRKHQQTSDAETPAGFMTRLFNAFTPAKKPKVDKGIEETPSLTTTSVPHNAIKSIRKGQASLHYTPESGLIYTSPNTIEMKSMIGVSLTKRLSYETPEVISDRCHKESPLLVHVKSTPRRSPRIAKRKLVKTTELA